MSTPFPRGLNDPCGSRRAARTRASRVAGPPPLTSFPPERRHTWRSVWRAAAGDRASLSAGRPRPDLDAQPATGHHRRAFDVDVDAEARLLTLSGDMDLAALDPFTAAAASLTSVRCGDVTVELAALHFVDASGLGAFVALNNILRSGGQVLTLRHATPCVVRTFDLGGLSALLAPAR